MEMGEKWPVNFACDSDFHINHRDFLHAANLRHGASGFSSLLEEGMPEKNPTASDGFERANSGTRGQHGNH
jgi:hypothetical protein